MSIRILAFDTALDACSAALLTDDEVVVARHEIRARGHAERLIPMIDEVLSEAGWRYQDLDLICVTRGPGSFTGLRIGLATARGLALALELPILGLGTLEALAAGVLARPRPAILALIDARRGQLYAQAFDRDGLGLGPPAALAPDRVAELAPPAPAAVVGTGAALALPYLAVSRPDLGRAEAPALPEAARFGRIAAERKDAAIVGVPPEPLYLRAPDAKLPAERP